jgi:hypothetical protein
MQRYAWIPAVLLIVTVAAPVLAAPQAPVLEQIHRPGPDVGFSFAAAGANIVYFPVRLAVTTVTAGVGGLAGCLTGGDVLTAGSIWSSTDGQAFITPQMFEGYDRLRFGPWGGSSSTSAESQPPSEMW